MKQSLFMVGVFTVFAMACGESAPPASEATEGSETTVTVVPPGSEAAPATPAAAAPAPVELTTDQLVAKYDECNRVWMAGDYAKLKADCLAADATSETVGSGMPVLSGADALVHEAQMWHASIGGIGMETIADLVSGHTVIGIRQYTGKQAGDLMGVPASGKPVGVYGAEVVELTAEGKVKATRSYFDIPTLMGQIGANKNPHRPALTPTDTPRVLAVAAGNDAEKKNLEIARGAIAAWHAGDYKALKAAFAKNWLHRDIQMATDQKGAMADASLKAYRTAFPDAKLEELGAVAAGDYVALEQRFTGTNKGKNPAMGIMKPTGKSVTARFLQVAKVQDGKIVEWWEIGNSMDMAMQLGLMPPPGQAPAPAAAPAPATKPTK